MEGLALENLVKPVFGRVLEELIFILKNNATEIASQFGTRYRMLRERQNCDQSLEQQKS